MLRAHDQSPGFTNQKYSPMEPSGMGIWLLLKSLKILLLHWPTLTGKGPWNLNFLLERNKTWHLVPTVSGRNVIDCK
jgi:hypothetical protein